MSNQSFMQMMGLQNSSRPPAQQQQQPLPQQQGYPPQQAGYPAASAGYPAAQPQQPQQPQPQPASQAMPVAGAAAAGYGAQYVKLLPPSLGPIVGHVSATDAVLWMRGQADGDGRTTAHQLDMNTRTVGVCVVLRQDNQQSIRVQYFRLPRENDRSGSVHLGRQQCLLDSRSPRPIADLQLRPGTTYQVRLAALTLLDPSAGAAQASDDDVGLQIRSDALGFLQSSLIAEITRMDATVCQATFTTEPATVRQPTPTNRNALSLIMVSSLRSLNPGLSYDREANTAARAVLAHVQSFPADSLLLLGGVSGRPNDVCPPGYTRRQRQNFEWAMWRDCYAETFSAPMVRQLLANVPCYTVSSAADLSDSGEDGHVDPMAQRAFQLFQHAINLPFTADLRELDERQKRMYFDTSIRGFPVFFADSYTRRAPGHILGRPGVKTARFTSQQAALCDWLVRQQQLIGDAAKFVVSAAPIVPDVSADASAGTSLPRTWGAYPAARDAVLSTLLANSVRNVVFLSSEMPGACAVEIRLASETSSVKAFAINVGPLVGTDIGGFVHTHYVAEPAEPLKLTGTSGTMTYTVLFSDDSDHFCRVDARENSVMASLFDPRGQVVQQHEMRLEASVAGGSSSTGAYGAFPTQPQQPQQPQQQPDAGAPMPAAQQQPAAAPSGYTAWVPSSGADGAAAPGSDQAQPQPQPQQQPQQQHVSGGAHTSGPLPQTQTSQPAWASQPQPAPPVQHTTPPAAHASSNVPSWAASQQPSEPAGYSAYPGQAPPPPQQQQPSGYSPYGSTQPMPASGAPPAASQAPPPQQQQPQGVPSGYTPYGAPAGAPPPGASQPQGAPSGYTPYGSVPPPPPAGQQGQPQLPSPATSAGYSPYGQAPPPPTGSYGSMPPPPPAGSFSQAPSGYPQPPTQQ